MDRARNETASQQEGNEPGGGEGEVRGIDDQGKKKDERGMLEMKGWREDRVKTMIRW